MAPTHPDRNPPHDQDASDEPRLRRVVIEEDQRRKLEHARVRHGYADDVSPHAHSQETFRLINQRKELDELPGAEFVVPMLDDWKYWTKMKDWDSRNRVLEDLTAKVKRREASTDELQFLVVVCGPIWREVTRSLRRYGGAALDPRADGKHRREESERVNALDNQELDQVVQHALLDALYACPRPFPRRFFPWLKETLAHRALDHVRQDLYEHDTRLPHDTSIKEVLDEMLSEPSPPGSALFSQWLRTQDVPAMFEIAREYVAYAGTQRACEAAVNQLPTKQRQVIQDHYYRAMTQTQIAQVNGVADSTVRNTHQGALRNLRKDDRLFDVLEAVGRVRDQARRLKRQNARAIADQQAA